MTYSAVALLTLAAQCAPAIAPETVLAIIHTESKGDAFAINVNGGRQPARQTNAASAVVTAQRYVKAGYSVDLGLGQINSRNMRWLGLTWETVFDPCTNIAALGKVMISNYNSVKAGRDPQTALRLALSMYNTGSQTRGFRNGYVAKVVRNAGIADISHASKIGVSNAIAGSTTAGLPSPIETENIAPIASKASLTLTPPPKWNVFERAAYERELLILVDSEGAIK